MEDILEYVAPLIGFLSFGTFSLIALRMWLTYRSSRHAALPPAEIARLAATVDDLRHQVDTLRDENAELQERMDFAERMLSRVKGGEGEVKGAIEGRRRES